MLLINCKFGFSERSIIQPEDLQRTALLMYLYYFNVDINIFTNINVFCLKQAKQRLCVIDLNIDDCIIIL